MQTVLVAGDSLAFTVPAGLYPPADGWTLKYRLVPRVSGTAIDITATTSGNDYAVSVAPAVTVLYGVGAYSWTSWVEKTGARHILDDGQITVLANPATATAGDTRGQAEKALADLKAAYATYTASQGQVAEYEIAGRRMRFNSAADIIQRMSFWKGELVRENAAKAAQLGLPDPRRIYLRACRA